MRRLIRAIAGLWLLIVILLIAALVLGHVLDGDSGIIAFQSGRVGDTDIYLYDVPTGVMHNLTRQPGRTPSTHHLLSEGDTAEYPTQPQHFVSQGSDVSPAWSPDGTRLAFVSYRDGNPEIYLLDLRSSQLRNLTNYPGSDSSPVWSPDGTTIAFETLREGYWGIWLAELETGTVRPLTEGATPASPPPGRRTVGRSCFNPNVDATGTCT